MAEAPPVLSLVSGARRSRRGILAGRLAAQKFHTFYDYLP
jgi:hypothetical protein